MHYITKSDIETQKIAKSLGKKFVGKKGIIALIGDLGAGKTTFTQGFAKGLGIKDKIISPTFVLIRQHNLKGQDSYFYHIDLYRLEDKKDIVSLGLREIFENKNIVLIEWADKIMDLLPRKTLFVFIEKVSPFERKIQIRQPKQS